VNRKLHRESTGIFTTSAEILSTKAESLNGKIVIFGSEEEKSEVKIQNRSQNCKRHRWNYLLGFTKCLQKSRTEWVNVQFSVSGTDRKGAPTQLWITYSSGAPPTRA
jgi:hypothetical protein